MPILRVGGSNLAVGGKRLTVGGVASPSGGSTPYGYLTPTLRDKRIIPCSENTCHALLALGSGATYSAAGITVENFDGYNTFMYGDTYIWQPDETAPALAVEYSGGAWTGATRCNDEGATLQTVRCPTSFVVAGAAGTYDNNCASFLNPDGITLKQNQPFTRCVASGIATTYVTFSDISIYGDGLHGPHGGSDIGQPGTIMSGEFAAGGIPHGLNINLRASRYYYRDTATTANTYRWPAFASDGYNRNDPVTGEIFGAPGTFGSRGYGGVNTNFKPGTLLALSTSFNVAGLSTLPARIMALALQDYGARVVDDAYSNGIGWSLARTPSSDVASEFLSLYGYAFRINDMTSGAAWALDMKAVVEALYIVTNDSSSLIGGGGTRRRANHSPIGN